MYAHQKRRIHVAIAIGFVGCIFFIAGILIGYFAIAESQKASVKKPYLRKQSIEIQHSLLNEINADNIRANLKELTGLVHRAGTKESLGVADLIRTRFIDYGLDLVEAPEYNVLLSYPQNDNPDTVVLLNDKGEVVQNISEGLSEFLRDEEKASPFANVQFNGYAQAGEVQTSNVVYANYGSVEDFQYLVDHGINIKGSLVLMRYGASWRGSKILNAEVFGAVGAILYPDPEQFTENVTSTNASDYFPHTQLMPPSGTQRGTLLNFNGDPLTPLLPSKDYVLREDIEDAIKSFKISSIPATPISAEAAQALLSLLGGDKVPTSWTGALPVAYRFGGKLQQQNRLVKLSVHEQNEQRPIRNVIGYIRGEIEPGRYVLLGNHHDAWTYGSVDPNDGTAIMLELARSFKAVMNATGWRPRRTIVFCSWDGEEYGLLGSYEWVEENMNRLQNQAVAYLNVDTAVAGNQTLSVNAIPSMQDITYESAKVVANPSDVETAAGLKSMYDSWMFHSKDPITNMPKIGLLGSGSDFTPFVDYIGTAAVDITYQSKEPDVFYPLYHTVHEVFYLMDMLIDPGFKYSKAIGQMWAEMTRLLADSLVLPFSLTAYLNAVQLYVDQLNTDTQLDLEHLNRTMVTFRDAVGAFEERIKKAIDSGE